MVQSSQQLYSHHQHPWHFDFCLFVWAGCGMMTSLIFEHDLRQRYRYLPGTRYVHPMILLLVFACAPIIYCSSMYALPGTCVSFTLNRRTWYSMIVPRYIYLSGVCLLQQYLAVSSSGWLVPFVQFLAVSTYHLPRTPVLQTTNYFL